jgi:hypothetical protein
MLRRVLARLDTVVLRVGFGETELDGDGVDRALLLPGQLVCIIFALLESRIQDLLSAHPDGIIHNNPPP